MPGMALLGRVALLLGLGGALGLVVNAIRPDGVPLRSVVAAPTSCSANPGVTEGSGVPLVEVLPPVEAVRLCGDPQTLIADVRDAGMFARGHVSDAIHLPCAAPSNVASAAIRLLAGRRTLIVYGNGTDDAKLVADELRARVARADLKVVVIAGGFAAWDQSGLACSSGPCPDCLVSPGDHR